MKYKNFLFIFVLVILLAIAAVSAEDSSKNQLWVSVDGTGSGNSMDDPANMISALDNVAPDYTVIFLDGTYEPNTYQINQRNITLKALNPGGVIFSGNDANELFRVAGVGIVLDGFTFKNGNINAYGGALFWGGSEGILKNCIFENNYAFSGGAVYWQGAEGLVDNCTFKGNAAGGAGAVHWAGPNSAIRNSIFEDNVAEVSDGGAIHWSSANGVIENCRFINNQAPNLVGGAIYWSGVNGTFINNTFRGNEDKSKYQFFNDGSVGFTNNLFFKNNAIFNNGTITSHLNVVIMNNMTKPVESNTNITLMATVTDDNANRIGGKGLTYIVEGKEINAPADVDVIYRADYEVGQNNVEISAKYPYGTDVTVYGAKLVTQMLVASDVVMYYKNGTRYVVYVGAANGTVNITINDRTYARLIENGQASLALNLNPGNYTIVASYGNSSIENKVTILATVDTANLVKYFKNDSQFIVKAVNSHGKPLVNYMLQFNINGVMYYRSTNESGLAKFNINLKPGEYIITTLGPNNCMVSNNVTVRSILVDNKNIVMYFKNGSRYSIRALDDEGNPAKGADVSFNINGVFYNVKTADDGFASLAINLYPEKYIITAIYKGSMVSNTIKIISTIDTDDVTMIYPYLISFCARIYDGHGDYLPGAEVIFNIEGNIYTCISGEYGFTLLDVDLPPGTYTITTYCNGLYVSNKIWVLTG